MTQEEMESVAQTVISAYRTKGLNAARGTFNVWIGLDRRRGVVEISVAGSPCCGIGALIAGVAYDHGLATGLFDIASSVLGFEIGWNFVNGFDAMPYATPPMHNAAVRAEWELGRYVAGRLVAEGMLESLSA